MLELQVKMLSAWFSTTMVFLGPPNSMLPMITVCDWPPALTEQHFM